MLSQWPVRYKLGLAFGSILLLMIASGALSYWAVQSAAEENREAMAYMELSSDLVEREVDHLTWMNELANTFLDEEVFTGELDYTQCSFGSWLYDFQDSERYRQASPELREAVDAMERPHIELHEAGAQIREVQQAGDFAAAEALYHEQAQQARSEFQARLAELRGILEEARAERVAAAEAQEARAGQVIVGGVGVALLLAAVLAVTIGRHLTGRLRRAAVGLEGIAAGEGDLTQRLPADGRDEIADLEAAYNQFADRLQEMIGVIQSSASQMASAIEQTRSSAEEDQRNVDYQRERVSEVATAMNEMTASVNEITRNTQDAAQAAQSASQHASQGHESVSRTVTAINSLAGNVRESGDTVRKLDEQSAQIGQVLEVIRDVAEQTNLLSLNAAIEAARAGEAGRGFTVVAEEVRKLAQKTQESTGSIQEMIERIQSGTQGAVEAMERNRQQAEETVSEAGQAGEVLDRIRQSVAQIDDLAGQIASSVEQQSQVAEEVNRNVTEISDKAEQTQRSVGETKEVAERLARHAEELQEQVGRFRV